MFVWIKFFPWTTRRRDMSTWNQDRARAKFYLKFEWNEQKCWRKDDDGRFVVGEQIGKRVSFRDHRRSIFSLRQMV